MPEFLIASPFKWQGEVKQQGMITLTAEDAEPLVCSGSLVPVLDSYELDDKYPLHVIDTASGEVTRVSANELQTLATGSAAADKRIFIVAKGRSVERNGNSFSEYQSVLLDDEDAAPLIESGDVLGMEQVAEMMRQAEQAKEQRLAEEQRKADEAARQAEEKRQADEAARLAEEQRKAAEQQDNKKKAKGGAAQS